MKFNVLFSPTEHCVAISNSNPNVGYKFYDEIYDISESTSYQYIAGFYGEYLDN